ncbi:MAG: sigma-70 family RNA polymerase sigma factor [Acidobacteriota bacterium]
MACCVPMVDEGLLLERARRGDRGAFDALVERYMDRIWRVAYRTVRHEEDAADVVQETFLTAWRSLANFRGDSSFLTWLHHIVMTRALNHLDRREERAARRAIRLDLKPSEAPQLADASPSPLQKLEERELATRLQRCVEQLPPAWRAVLTLREGEGLSYEAIAKATDIALGTVRSQLARARAALLACIEGRER